jgi:hypothetical protein
MRWSPRKVEAGRDRGGSTVPENRKGRGRNGQRRQRTHSIKLDAVVVKDEVVKEGEGVQAERKTAQWDMSIKEGMGGRKRMGRRSGAVLTQYHTWNTMRMVAGRHMPWHTSCAALVRTKRHEK